MIIYSAIAAVIPILFYLLFIWLYDKYDREPISILLLNFFWGAIGATFLAILSSAFFENFLFLFLGIDEIPDILSTVIIAPFLEEFTKAFFLLFTVMHRKFDNMTDGIVYGGAIGLGFGMTENFIYFSYYAETTTHWVYLVIVRTLFTAVMHFVSTATVGAFFGLAKFRKKPINFLLPFSGYLFAVIIHSGWNLSVSFQSTYLFGFAGMFVLILIFITLFSVSVKNEKKMLIEELTDEAKLGNIPFEHIDVLCSARKRKKSGWIDNSVRKIYINAATRLSFRKMQLKYATENRKSFYFAEIDKHRSIISKLLNRS